MSAAAAARRIYLMLSRHHPIISAGIMWYIVKRAALIVKDTHRCGRHNILAFSFIQSPISIFAGGIQCTYYRPIYIIYISEKTPSSPKHHMRRAARACNRVSDPQWTRRTHTPLWKSESETYRMRLFSNPRKKDSTAVARSFAFTLYCQQNNHLNI